MPRLSRSRSGRPPSSLPSAPLGAQSDPLPTDPPGAAPPSRRREPASADRHPRRGRAGRFLSACARRAAAALLPGGGALRDAAPGRARAFPATADRDAARPARRGARRPVSAGALACVLLGFAALLAAPQTAHAVDKEIWSATLTTGATTSPSTLFGVGASNFPGSISGTAFGLDILELEGGGNRSVIGIRNDNASGGTLTIGVEDFVSGTVDPLANSGFRSRVTLDVGTESFVGASATYGSSAYERELVWTSSGLTWAAAQSITVSLKLNVPGISSVAFSSSPATGTTYDTGETVTATVTFDEAVDVDTSGGTPQLTIDMGGSDKVLDYSSGTGTTALVFSGYRVALGDTDSNGLSIAADKLDLNGGTIKATADAHPAAVLTHTAVANSASHKVNGATVPAGPTVDSIAFNSAGTDGAFKTGDAVTATVTFSESVTVDTTGGTPQLTIKMGGADKVLDYSSGSPGTALVFSGYTVAANDEDTDGLSVEANKLDANGGTIQQTADTSVAAVLTHAAVAASANHKVDGVKPTLVTTGDNAPKTSLDGSKIILVFSEAIGGVDRTKITVKVGTTTETTTAESINGTKVEITLTTALADHGHEHHRGARRRRRHRRARQRHRRGVRDVRHANPSPGQTRPDAGGEGPVHRRDGRFHGPRHVEHHEVPVPHQDHRLVRELDRQHRGRVEHGRDVHHRKSHQRHGVHGPGARGELRRRGRRVGRGDGDARCAAGDHARSRSPRPRRMPAPTSSATTSSSRSPSTKT